MQVTCPICGADFTARPDHLPNHVYYTHEMVTKRVRLVVDADVEWREDDPTYSLSAAELDIQTGESVRVRNVTPVSSEFLGEMRFQVAGQAQ